MITKKQIIAYIMIVVIISIYFIAAHIIGNWIMSTVLVSNMGMPVIACIPIIMLVEKK